MSAKNQTPVPAGFAVQILFCIRANKGLYGYAYGPFRYDESRKCYVYQSRTFSVEQWEAEGQELIQRFYKYRCSVKVEVVQAAAAIDDATAPSVEPVASPADPASAPAAEEPAPVSSVKRARKPSTPAPAE